MKILPKTFRKSGFDYIQVAREGMVAIYRQTRLPALFELYEVGRIRENKEREAFGQQFEASESWPNSEEWGIRAWTYPDFAAAKKRMESLLGSNA